MTNIAILSPDFVEEPWPDVSTLRSYHYRIRGTYGSGDTAVVVVKPDHLENGSPIPTPEGENPRWWQPTNYTLASWEVEETTCNHKILRKEPTHRKLECPTCGHKERSRTDMDVHKYGHRREAL